MVGVVDKFNFYFSYLFYPQITKITDADYVVINFEMWVWVVESQES